MAPKADDSIFDGAWNVLKNQSDRMDVCAGEPANVTDARVTRSLANQAMVSGDYTIANGDTSGRKVTVTAKSNVPITASGTADHVAHTSATVLLYVFEATATGLVNGNQVNISTHKAEILDPVTV